MRGRGNGGPEYMRKVQSRSGARPGQKHRTSVWGIVFWVGVSVLPVGIPSATAFAQATMVLTREADEPGVQLTPAPEAPTATPSTRDERQPGSPTAPTAVQEGAPAAPVEPTEVQETPAESVVETPTPMPRAIPPHPQAERGNLLDRNGLPLAINRDTVTKVQRKALLRHNIDIYTVCEDPEERCYPLGGSTFHLLGDIRMPIRWNHPRTGFLERELNGRLSGEDTSASPLDSPIFMVDAYNTQFAPAAPRTQHITTSIDARLQIAASTLMSKFMERRKLAKGAMVVLDVATSEVLALVSYPFPETVGKDLKKLSRSDDAFYDRARHVYYAPGSTFKLVTSMAALRKDPALEQTPYTCVRLKDPPETKNSSKNPKDKPQRRVGCTLPDGSIIRDDELDLHPHGDVKLEDGLFHSCNAYFSQLGLLGVQSQSLIDTAGIFGIEVARPNTAEEVDKTLPQSAFGQGEVLATPFEMATVAATIANKGRLLQPTFLSEDDAGYEWQEGIQVITEEQAALLGRAMRKVVLKGTAKEIRKKTTIAIAGKTGTAEVDRRASHGWFVGYAPYEVVPNEDGTMPRQIAFAILLENSGYGGRTAAPLAARLVNAAMGLGILQGPPPPPPAPAKTGRKK